MTAPERPALRYHGGKWMLAPWLLEFFPPHRIYTEVYGGAGSVLLRKPRSYAEVYNDLDGEVVNLFRVLRDTAMRAQFVEAIALTPFARAEFELSYEVCEDSIERARRLVIRSFMGFGSDGHNAATKTGFRADSNRSGTTPAHDWNNLAPSLRAVGQRFEGVVVEHRPALQVLQSHDRPDALHYVDPPYLPETRSVKSRRAGMRYHAYVHEMTIEDHLEMLELLKRLEGAIVLSGYPAETYDQALKGWGREERQHLADGARPRVEVVWFNDPVKRFLDQRHKGGDTPLFAHRT